MSALTPESITRQLQRTLRVLDEEAGRAMREAVDLTARRMRELAPRGQTGKLGEDLAVTAHTVQAGVSGSVRPRRRYARFVEHGTGTRNETGFHHPIQPAAGRRIKPGATLRFAGPDGTLIYRRHTKGQKPQPFVERTREQTAGEVERILEDGALRATRRLFP